VPLVERLVVENALDAAAQGALVLNHARATGYLRDGDRVTGAQVRDGLGGNDLAIGARYTVNATGAWLDETIAPLRGPAKPLLRLTKGVHLVTPQATEQAHVLFAKRDGRLFFVVPWRDYSIVGTTDTDYNGDPAAADATEDDVRYLQAEARAAFPNAPFEVIHFTWSGIRALVRVEGVAEGEVSRKHALYDHQRRDGIAGVLSVIGGKITAYRDIAEEVADRVVQDPRWRRARRYRAGPAAWGRAERWRTGDGARSFRGDRRQSHRGLWIARREGPRPRRGRSLPCRAALRARAQHRGRSWSMS